MDVSKIVEKHRKGTQMAKISKKNSKKIVEVVAAIVAPVANEMNATNVTNVEETNKENTTMEIKNETTNTAETVKNETETVNAPKDLNVYSWGKYHAIFANILRMTSANEKGGTVPVTKADVESFCIESLGMALSKAQASVNVIFSPRKDNSNSIDCRGNPSARGHLYYFDPIAEKKITVGKLGTTEETQYMLCFRETALAQLKRPELTPDELKAKLDARLDKSSKHYAEAIKKQAERAEKKAAREAAKLANVGSTTAKKTISAERKAELTAHEKEIMDAKKKIVEARILEVGFQIKSLEAQIASPLKDSVKQGTADERKAKKVAKLEVLKTTLASFETRLAKMNAPPVVETAETAETAEIPATSEVKAESTSENTESVPAETVETPATSEVTA